jgi:hypothetical protein
MRTPGITFRDVVRGSLVVLVIMLVVAYVVYQARFLIIGPQIILTTEPDRQQNERVLTLSGTTNNISRLWLNGNPIFTDPQGNFEAAVVLENGYTITKLEAEDRYGRRTSLTREFVYVPMNFK